MQAGQQQSLSNVQLELLRVYSMDIAEEDVIHIRRYLANYFMQKSIDAADKVWDERGYTNELMDEWLNESNIRQETAI